MERKRGRLEIARDILTIAKSGTGITAIVYGANLNFPIAKKHIQEMELAGLITVRELPGSGNKLYTTTDRGLIFMESLGRTLITFQPPVLTQEVSDS